MSHVFGIRSDCSNVCVSGTEFVVHIYSFNTTNLPMGPVNYINMTISINIKRDGVGCTQSAPNTLSAVSVTDT